MSEESQEEFGRTVILDLIEAHLAEQAAAGIPAMPQPAQRELAGAVFDSLFRLGRLQPLVDLEQVENIRITGSEPVILQLPDGSEVAGPPVADSDQELIDFLVFVASRSQVNARPFSQAHPYLDLRLDGGARLTACAWVTHRPQVVIRRHRLVKVTLEDLVGLDMLSPVASSFLAAAVRARKSIVVSGAAGAGKTTLVRALCHEIGAAEHVGTFETEYELHLNELRDNVIAWEGRPGSGERTSDGGTAGESTIDEALYRSFRYGLSRQIVGEVRGAEIWAMIKTMESGTGSLSTTHSTDAVAAIRKLTTCAMEAGSHVTHELATSKLAATIDLVVHIDLSYDPGATGPRRQVTEIVAVDPGEHATGFATTHVFAPDQHGAALPAVLPDTYRELVGHGFDLAGFVARSQGAR
ncbi:CpaF family protein [Myceligenerans cantabricum]